jgi:preprotein translocase subunit SecD
VILGLVFVALAVWAFWPGTDHTPRLGLDLRGGTQVILVPKSTKPGEAITDAQLNQTVEIIRQRVNGVGVAEAEVTTQGSGDNAAIVVAVPGVNQDRLVELVGRTALLDFRPVYAISDPAPVDVTPSDSASPSASADGSASASPSPSPSASASPSDAASPSATPESGSATPSPSGSATQDGQQTGNQLVQSAENDAAFAAEVAKLDCLSEQNRAGGSPDDPDLWLGTCDRDGAGKYTLEPAFIKGTNVTGADAVLPQNGVGWVVSLQFDSEGAKALADSSSRLSQLPDCGTGSSPCNAFAIVLDGVVVSAPRFNEPILGGQAQIEGNFSAQEAADLANVLKFGALPVTLEIAEVTSVSPTIGAEQLNAGLIAGALGLVLVMLYLLLYYRALGIVAGLSLVVAAAFSYVLFVVLGKSIGFTLTLAGVAGAIVAIGITADSFVVYFERIRDEIREGKSLRQAIDAGWSRALRTLLAADFVSLLAAIVLYWLSVGSVRGFAFTLGLTTLVDVAVAIMFTHPTVVLLGRTKWMQRGSKWTGLNPERLGGHSLAGAAAESRTRRPRGAAGSRSERTPVATGKEDG